MHTKQSPLPRYFFQNGILTLIASIPLIAWGRKYMRKDAWWDELLSITEFILQDPLTTVTSYPQPNNHIFFSLVSNVWTWVLGVRDLYEVLDHIYLLRAMQVLVTLGACVYAFLLIKRFFTANNAALVTVLLATSVPFLNFSLQIRGYNLSCLFLVMLIYYSWSYLDAKRWYHLAFLTLVTTAFFYTIPSNAYFIAALGIMISFEQIGVLLRLFRARRSSKAASEKPNFLGLVVSLPQFHVIAALSIGVLLGVLFYLPVIEKVLDNRFVSKVPRHAMYEMIKLCSSVLSYLFSYRWLVLLPIVIALILAIKQSPPAKKTWRYISLVGIFLLPFLFAAFHQKVPFDRTFLPLAGVFAMLVCLPVLFLLQRIRMNALVRFGLVLILSLYSVANTYQEVKDNNQLLAEAFEAGDKKQSMYTMFFLANEFEPNADAVKVAHLLDSTDQLMMVDLIDRLSYGTYLLKHDVSSVSLITIKKQPIKVKEKQFTHLATYEKRDPKDQSVMSRGLPFSRSNKPDLDKYLILNTVGTMIEKQSSLIFATNAVSSTRARLETLYGSLNEVARIDSSGALGLLKVTKGQPDLGQQLVNL